MNGKNIVSTTELPLTVYSPESPIRRPMCVVWQIFADVWSARELIQMLFARDLKAQYRQSYLGYFWIFAPTICTTLIWTFLSSQELIQVSATPIPYPVYVLVGSMLWGLFASGVNQPLASFQAGSSVFMKLKVPPEAFVAAGLAQVLFDLVVRMLLLIPVFIAFRIAPPATIVLFPVAILCLLVFAVAIGILLIPVGSLYRDVSRAVTMGLGFGMYLTPVIYPPATSGLAARLVNLNPLTPFIVTGRDWLTIGACPYADVMLLMTLIACAGLIASLVVFRVSLPHLIARMGM